MYKIVVLALTISVSLSTHAQSNYEKFRELFKEGDTARIKLLLSEWEKNNSGDPELYTSSINYYFSNAKKEIVSLNKQQVNKQSFQIKDSSGNVVGFINSDIGYDPDKLSEAFKYANAGIAKFPDRLDIRFGKCYMLQQIGDYTNFTKEIIDAINYSTINKNNWLWTENQKQEDGEKFLLETVQTYLTELYDTQNDDLLPNMIQIGETALKYYPDNIKILSTTSVALLLSQQYDKAIAYLKQAEEINPEDYIVLNNIAQGYKLKGDKQNAVKYYKLTEKYGDEQAKQQARQNIKQLEK